MVKELEKVFVINPGSGSTKVSLFSDTSEVFSMNVRHDTDVISSFNSVRDQRGFRKECIDKALADACVSLSGVSAVIGRGGPLKPMPSGTYTVNSVLENDLMYNFVAEHASLLGGLLALDYAREAGVTAYIADPVSVDEMDDVARLSGHPDIERKSLAHALNIKAVARATQKEVGRPYSESSLVIAHLGSGISITAHRKGRMIDVSNANSGGPYSPERAGGLPTCELLDWVFSKGLSKKEAVAILTKKGGLAAYSGTIHAYEVEQRIGEGDARSKLVYDGMVYQIAKEIGAMAAALSGRVDAVVVTGGLAKAPYLVKTLEPMISFIARVIWFPGEDEMGALRDAGLRVLRGEEGAVEL